MMRYQLCHRRSRVASLVLVTGLLASCKPSDILSVPPPVGVSTSAILNSQTGAESALAYATASLYQALSQSDQLLEWSSTLSDEFTWSAFAELGDNATVDARFTVATSTVYEVADEALGDLLSARSSLLLVQGPLGTYEPASGQSKVGTVLALVGYSELVMAEDYCAGVPLSAYVPGGGIVYGTPLTTDSLLGTAAVHFDSALKHAAGNDTVLYLASVGLGRALLNRGMYSQAAAAVAGVPTSFVYNTELPPTYARTGQPNVYEAQLPAGNFYGCGFENVSDHEGGNGLNFASAQDPRLVLDSTIATTCDGGVWYYPIKFGNPSTYVPLATGVEARLIQAEAALEGGQVATWAGDLNTLRQDESDTKITFPPATAMIAADSTTGASADMQVDVMFRERAFWLFGTGTRLGDLRRLIRQYGRDASTVYPIGVYPGGEKLTPPIPEYGTDVNITLPTQAGGAVITNPNYRGCITSTKTA
jgi:starch-binding outer membrane protein, SusD/RagB family